MRKTLLFALARAPQRPKFEGPFPAQDTNYQPARMLVQGEEVHQNRKWCDKTNQINLDSFRK